MALFLGKELCFAKNDWKLVRQIKQSLLSYKHFQSCSSPKRYSLVLRKLNFFY